MLILETIARIRRDHLDRGKSIKEIARELNLSRNTVRRVLRPGARAFVYEREVQPRPKLGVGTQDLERLLMTNSTAACWRGIDRPAGCDEKIRSVLSPISSARSHSAPTWRAPRALSVSRI